MKSLSKNMRHNIDITSGPVIFSMQKKEHRAEIEKLKRQGKIQRIIDSYESQREELCEIKKQPGRAEQGVWMYYPWNFSLVHTLGEKDFRKVRTARNQNLITRQEQQRLERTTIGIAGLNVGNPAAVCLALEGFEKLKLADNDFLSLSNLNRFRAGVHQIGMNKTHLTAQQIFEINPFARLELFPEGITQQNMETFFAKPKIDILIEEMDNLKLKIYVREKARKLRVPVVMVTGNAENVILDIERYDKNPRLPLLNGYLKKSVMEKVEQLDMRKGTQREKVLLARDFIGSQHLTKKLRQSFLEVGSKLGGIPQIAEASFTRGAVLCYATRQILLGAKTPSGRYFMNLSDMF